MIFLGITGQIRGEYDLGENRNKSAFSENFSPTFTQEIERIDKMLFSSMIFLWAFLPIVIIINFLLSIVPFPSEVSRIKAKNAFLLVSSMFFYAWGGINYLLIMLFSVLINYFGGRLLGKDEADIRCKKAKLALILLINLSNLFVFKYFNMVVSVIEAGMNMNGDIKHLVYNVINLQGTGVLGIAKIGLPIGISFFTFQAMSYVIDVYRGKATVQRNIFDFALYVSFFPQLIAGPIVKYSDIEVQLQGRKETINLFVSGQKRFCYGLGKKVLLANTFAEVADNIWKLDIPRVSTGVAWLGIIAYTLQIYYDFSGYSDMAIGIGRMLGFSFKENFDYPYTSLSIREFWRRWHISLSSWFKEYVYIPLGGNHHGDGRTCFNIFIVFLLTGIWHGANFTFFVWGIFYAIMQILERLFLDKILEKNPFKVFNWLYCIFFVMIGWVFFRSNTIFQAMGYLKQMFTGTTSYYTVNYFLSMRVIIAVVIGILLSGFMQRLFKCKYKKVCNQLLIMVCDLAIQVGVLILSILMLVSGTYNPFIYFQF